jgi:hypothetical protein
VNNKDAVETLMRIIDQDFRGEILLVNENLTDDQLDKFIDQKWAEARKRWRKWKRYQRTATKEES